MYVYIMYLMWYLELSEAELLTVIRALWIFTVSQDVILAF